MAAYERNTAATTKDALRLAEQILTARLPITKVRENSQALTLQGGDGTVTIKTHRHGLHTIVRAVTDQLATSRLDVDVQYYMSQLPYEPGDASGL
jgi:hypothetical protein